MKKVFTKQLFLLSFAAIALAACQNEDSISKPINSDASAADITESVKAGAEGSDLDEARKAREEILTKEAEAKANSQSATLPKTAIAFDKAEHDFGVINEGDDVEHIFKFTNTGTEPLILENCKGSCGCTVPQCPKNPIPPGASGDIKVVFNSKGKKNMQTKRVTITANTEPMETVLTIKANVTPES
ncbi:MAG: DUF1573 domain-containing protein [Flavobacteriales bacterium]